MSKVLVSTDRSFIFVKHACMKYGHNPSCSFRAVVESCVGEWGHRGVVGCVTRVIVSTG